VSLDDETFASLTETRVSAPHKIAEALAGRRRRRPASASAILCGALTLVSVNEAKVSSSSDTAILQCCLDLFQRGHRVAAQQA
jgi:hypothetical protein